MAKYKCSGCGHTQNTSNGCDNCKANNAWFNSNMELIDELQDGVEDLNKGIYGDGVD